MEPWREVWRNGLAPCLSVEAMEALRAALLKDDARLIQGATTTPPPMKCVQDWPVEAACGIGYCGWQGEQLGTVAECEEYFADVCYNCDLLMKEPAACRFFLNFFDETPRDEMRRLLLPEVSRSIAIRVKEERDVGRESCGDHQPAVEGRTSKGKEVASG